MEHVIAQADGEIDFDPAGDLDAELAQLTDVESLVANIYARSCSTNSTAVCSGGICCL